MKNKSIKKIVLGAVVIAVGVIFALWQLDLVDINVFFDGWWTLFIIIPSLIGLITERKLDNLIGIGIGAVLLLACQDVISFDIVGKLIVPAIIVIIGIKLIIGGASKNRAGEIFDKREREGKDGEKIESAFALFSANELDFTARKFDVTELCAIFGSVKCDISGAEVAPDAAIKATAVFGGIDILVPKNVNLKISSTSLFGGVEKKIETNPDAPTTLHINAVCIFGGVDIK